MELTVSNQIVEILDALCEKFGIAIDWTSQNVLPYAQELMEKGVRYELWTSIAWIVGFGLLTGVLWFVVWKISRASDFDWNMVFIEGLPTIALALSIIGSFLILLFVYNVFQQGIDIITCLTFPEKIILDMLKTVA